MPSRPSRWRSPTLLASAGSQSRWPSWTRATTPSPSTTGAWTGASCPSFRCARLLPSSKASTSRRSAVTASGPLHDSPEIRALIAEIEALRWTGRPGYGVRAMVGMTLAKGIYALPTWSRIARLVAEHPGLQATLGCAPSQWACLARSPRRRRASQPVVRTCVHTLALIAPPAASPSTGNPAVAGLSRRARRDSNSRPSVP
jgi:hypothetical protein